MFALLIVTLFLGCQSIPTPLHNGEVVTVFLNSTTGGDSVQFYATAATHTSTINKFCFETPISPPQYVDVGISLNGIEGHFKISIPSN